MLSLLLLQELSMSAKQHNVGFQALVNDAKARVQEIDASELPALLAANPGAALIDVREDTEFADGHLQGAEHIGKGVVERDIENAHPDKSQPLYLYCGGGYRSALVADALRLMGYANAVTVDGGWRALKELMPAE